MMPDYNAMLSKLERQVGVHAPVRFVCMNLGETHGGPAARAVLKRSPPLIVERGDERDGLPVS